MPLALGVHFCRLHRSSYPVSGRASTVCPSQWHRATKVCPSQFWRASTVCSSQCWRASTVCPSQCCRASNVCPSQCWRASTVCPSQCWRASTECPSQCWRASTVCSSQCWRARGGFNDDNASSPWERGVCRGDWTLWGGGWGRRKYMYHRILIWVSGIFKP